MMSTLHYVLLRVIALGTVRMVVRSQSMRHKVGKGGNAECLYYGLSHQIGMQRGRDGSYPMALPSHPSISIILDQNQVLTATVPCN